MLGPLLRQLRRTRGMTQHALAQHAGIGQTYISELERGLRANPSREVMQSMADALKVPVALLAQAAWQKPVPPIQPQPENESPLSAFLEEMTRLEPQLLPHYQAALISAARALVQEEATAYWPPTGGSLVLSDDALMIPDDGT